MSSVHQLLEGPRASHGARLPGNAQPFPTTYIGYA